MKHYQHLSIEDMESIFYIQPSEFNKYTPREVLANALGATMYTPATKKDIAKTLIERKYPELTTNVFCLEDAIANSEVLEAEENLLMQLDILNLAVAEGRIDPSELPLLFIRVRDPQQLKKLLVHCDKFQWITGFNLPKFTSKNGEAYLKPIVEANKVHNESFYAMPILESPEVMYIEYREIELIKIKGILDNYQDIILNIRLGGTDFSSLYGIRRGVDFTIYDIKLIADALADIVNLFGRAQQKYTISGVVWEYFPESNRLLKPQLRFTPFLKKKGEAGLRQREEIICKEIDGLVKEIVLDKANNLTGKTIIHPTHITYVNGLQAVTYEEYMDAMTVLNTKDKGVIKGGNKMNEIKPHHNWAVKILNKSKIYGVLNKNAEYIQLF